MTIKEVAEKIKESDKPVARVLHKGQGFNALIIGFPKDAILNEHSSKTKAKLTVLRGSVIYKQGDLSHALNKFDEYDIPAGEVHSVEATNESICLLTQGD